MMDDKKLSECSFEELLTAALVAADKQDIPLLAFSGEKEGETRKCITGRQGSLAFLIANGMAGLEEEHPIVLQLLHALYDYQARKGNSDA